MSIDVGGTGREPLIELRSLEHAYLRGTPLETPALRGITLRVLRGEALGIIGRSGSGKSTTVQHMNGLLRPIARGQALVYGQDMADPGLDIRTIRQKVGLVFQHPEDQLFERLVGDDVAFGPLRMGLTLDEARDRVRWAMDAVGLDLAAFKDRFTFSLSGGEMRKVAIAGVLALKPEVLVLDESTSGLDPRGRRELLALMRRWKEREGLTIVFVSCNMEDIAALVDRVCVLDQGRSVLEGQVREVFSRPAELQQYGLNAPQITEILVELKERGLDVDPRCSNVAEAEEQVWKTLST
ncbi:MAG: Energy-coupling factor transporter ATP-binding protein EcfA2 [Chloroflexi bacterium ADurb.Bin180]|nr:MAG: Energy-coupling factor transporter ATP-binding protein EcfA2 [Chloroflexi bacterium ADurb.Bin180]HNR96103.1 energy-coupling factor transporter ATPase [Anaerolineae bacterium]